MLYICTSSTRGVSTSKKYINYYTIINTRDIREENKVVPAAPVDFWRSTGQRPDVSPFRINGGKVARKEEKGQGGRGRKDRVSQQLHPKELSLARSPLTRPPTDRTEPLKARKSPALLHEEQGRGGRFRDSTLLFDGRDRMYTSSDLSRQSNSITY
jgi:hypothetical protein